MIYKWYKLPGAMVLAMLMVSCATYYEINGEFNRSFEAGNIQGAERVLTKNRKRGFKKEQFLYDANQGVVNAMLGNLEESNDWFEKAYIFGEDYQKNYASIVASFLVNPNTVVYPGEDHEQLLLLYYKALNYLKTNDYESALIECRRLINRLNTLSDKYKSPEKYRQDAFIHNLMGIIYEASGDINNAFIAYRNAYNIYQEDYLKLFNVPPPEQLKEDLLRAAYQNGFDTELDYYEQQFGRKYIPSKGGPELIFFWHNGLGPVKYEWSINFTTVGGDGFVTFANEDLGMSFPFMISDPSEQQQLTDLRFLRIAFPRYRERKLFFDRGVLELDSGTFALQRAENIDAIAKKTLQERMVEELSKGLLRAAIKKSVEMAVRGDQSGGQKSEEEKREEAIREGLSMLVGVVNAVTEKADTRNWQTLPHDICYARVPLHEGTNQVKLKTIADTGEMGEESFTFEVSGKETIFYSYRSLEFRR